MSVNVPGAINLRQLGLRGNQLTVVPAFPSLPALDYLDLEDNLVTAVPAGVFDLLPALAMLDIRGNPLVCDCGVKGLYDVSSKF